MLIKHTHAHTHPQPPAIPPSCWTSQHLGSTVSNDHTMLWCYRTSAFMNYNHNCAFVPEEIYKWKPKTAHWHFISVLFPAHSGVDTLEFHTLVHIEPQQLLCPGKKGQRQSSSVWPEHHQTHSILNVNTVGVNCMCGWQIQKCDCLRSQIYSKWSVAWGIFEILHVGHFLFGAVVSDDKHSYGRVAPDVVLVHF